MAKDDDLVSMKRPKRTMHLSTAHEMSEEYGYGLCLRLENPELDALKLAMPQPGKEFKITAVGKVVSVNESKMEGNEKGDRSVMIQITAMAVR